MTAAGVAGMKLGGLSLMSEISTLTTVVADIGGVPASSALTESE